jgi:hypothetical protein
MQASQGCRIEKWSRPSRVGDVRALGGVSASNDSVGAIQLGTDRRGRTEQYLIVSSQKEEQKGLKCHQLGQETERRVFPAPFSQLRVYSSKTMAFGAIARSATDTPYSGSSMSIPSANDHRRTSVDRRQSRHPRRARLHSDAIWLYVRSVSSLKVSSSTIA